MTTHLPRFIDLLGMFGLGVIAALATYAVVGFMTLIFMDRGPGDILAASLHPLSVIAFITGVVVAYIWII